LALSFDGSCIEFDYDLRVLVVYHGAEIYQQSDVCLKQRLAMAARGLPGIMPALPRPRPLVVRELLFHPKLADSRGTSEATEGTEGSEGALTHQKEEERVRDRAAELSAHVCSQIEKVYAQDAEAVYVATGERLRHMTIRSRL
jgi:hypothetical protein